MVRDPFDHPDQSHDESPDGVLPSPSSSPAGERSVFPDDGAVPPSPPSPTSQYPGSTDRPAGAIPPPPPPPGGPARPAPFPAQPPTAERGRPPVSDAPPRPVFPDPTAFGAAGPPLAPPPAPVAGPPPPARRRGWRVAAALVAAFALLAGGVAIGAVVVVDDTDPPTDQVASTSTLRQAADAPAAPEIPDVPGPLAGADSEEPVADVARAVAPSVVLIRAGFGQGSGIVWDATSGYIVTNDHVVGDNTNAQVRLPDGNEVDGVVVGNDPARDLAVIEIDPTGLQLQEAVFAPTDTVEVGQIAVAIGSPFGLDQTVTAGIVSAVNRINEFGGSDPRNPVPVEMIQTDAPINPGNSGGALADREGRVIGMNTSIRTDGDSEGNVGVGFAIPADTIMLIAQRIIAGESLELGFLGIEGETPPDGTNGALVTGVMDGLPASEGGIQVGDLIVGLEGAVVASMDALAAEVKLYRPGDSVEIEIVRDGERFVVDVTLGDPVSS